MQFLRSGGFVKANLPLPNFVEYAYPRVYSSGYGFIAGQTQYSDGTKGIGIWEGTEYKDLRVMTDASGTWSFVMAIGVSDDGDLLIRAKQGAGAELYYTCRRK